MDEQTKKKLQRLFVLALQEEHDHSNISTLGSNKKRYDLPNAPINIHKKSKPLGIVPPPPVKKQPQENYYHTNDPEKHHSGTFQGCLCGNKATLCRNKSTKKKESKGNKADSKSKNTNINRK